MVVKGDDLVIATHGRAFWILDNVTPLRQVAQAQAASGFYLYTPQTAYHLYYPDAVDSRPPVGQNPPAGALIDYYLPAQPSGAISMDIFDDKGTLVRHLTSAKSNRHEQPQEWPDLVQPTDTLPAQQGMNRFVWNLRYNDPAQIPGAFYVGLAPRGPIALPGKYTVKLTYGGQTQSVPLVIVPDPRVKGPLTGLQQKFALDMQVYHDLDALHRAVNDIRAARSEVQAAIRKNAALAAEGNALVQKMGGIEGQLMQVNMKGSEANLNFPGMLNEQIYSFGSILEDSDTAPNAEEIALSKDLHGRLGVQLADWDNVKKTQLAAFRAHAQGGSR